MKRSLFLIFFAALTAMYSIPAHAEDGDVYCLTRDLAATSKTSTLIGSQYAVSGEIILILNNKPYETEAGDEGELRRINKYAVIPEGTLGTFSKKDANGVIWVTFNVKPGFISGDTIDLPFLPLDIRENTCYVLKPRLITGSVVGGTVKTSETFPFKGNTVEITRGYLTASLTIMYEEDEDVIEAEDRKVGKKYTAQGETVKKPDLSKPQ